MGIGIVFSGQGSQKTGMGYDLYRHFPEVASFYDHLEMKHNIKDLSFFADKETLSRTQYTQPVLVAFQLILLEIIKNMDVPITWAAGVSLGEFSALVAADMISKDDCLALIEKRGQLMSEACQKNPSTLIAILGQCLDNVKSMQRDLKKQSICMEIANYNTKTQIVVGCRQSEEQGLMDYLDEMNIAYKKLNVEGAFHTSLMDDAAIAFKKELELIDFKEPSIDVASNYTGRLYGKDSPAALLSNQMNHMTRFKDIIDRMKDCGIDYVLEIGYNNVIKKMLKREVPEIQVIPIRSVEDLEKLKTRTFHKLA